MSKWYIDKGDQGDIVLSTRIRLARNLDEFPFPAKLDIAGKNKVNELIKGILFENDRKDFSYIEMKDLSRIQAVSLAERTKQQPTSNRLLTAIWQKATSAQTAHPISVIPICFQDSD